MTNNNQPSMKKNVIGLYSILLGFSVIFLWTFILRPFDQQEGTIEMGFHLMSEFLMACFCIVSGVKILLRHKESFLINSAAHGMVVYSVVNAAGYYGERGNWPMMVMFLFLFSFSFIVIVMNFRGNQYPPK
jgi:hypothetical protein